MFVFVLFLAISISTWLNNNSNNISNDNPDSYSFDGKSKFLVLGLFLIALILDFTSGFYRDIKSFVLLGYVIVSFFSMMTSNYLRIEEIKKKRGLINEIYQCLETLDNKKKDPEEEIDFNTIPFNYVLDESQVLSLVDYQMQGNPNNYKDRNIILCIDSLNRVFSDRNWIYTIDIENRSLKFIGEQHPPDRAMYPGSDLRPWNWIPLGVNGKGELGWNLGADEIYSSLFKYENGLSASTLNVSKAPQALVLGPTGGGKAIYIKQKVQIVDENEK